MGLLAKYATADLNRNSRLSWDEISVFQRELYRNYAYQANDNALRPDEFIDSGGGDCEDWALVTAGLLEFWGYQARVGSIRSPDNSRGHAVCLVFSLEKPSRHFYYHFSETGQFNGDLVEAGYYIPIDYNLIGRLSNAVESGWELRRIYTPEKIYGVAM